jgi:hypothetical protein
MCRGRLTPWRRAGIDHAIIGHVTLDFLLAGLTTGTLRLGREVGSVSARHVPVSSAAKSPVEDV